jgi:hypothetical protein
VALTCTAEDGAVSTQAIEVRSDPEANDAGNPAPAPSARPRRVRPALQGDPNAPSNRELVARGYPPRPDADPASDGYRRWLSLVSQEFEVVSPRAVARPRRYAAPAEAAPLRPSPAGPSTESPTLPVPPPGPDKRFDFLSSNWSGAVVPNPGVRFYQIQGEWYVPAVRSDLPFYGYAAAGEWVGIDNSASDLVQSGSDSEAWNIWLPGASFQFTNYSMWVESLPNISYGLPNVPVSPGDQVSVDIWVGDLYGNPVIQWGDLTPADNTVWFLVYNLSAHLVWLGTYPLPSPFAGSTAEFIMERPKVNGSIVPLADYGVASMYNCWFADTWLGFTSLDSGSPLPYPFRLSRATMVNGSDVLSVPYVYSNFFGGGGGGNVLFVWDSYL